MFDINNVVNNDWINAEKMIKPCGAFSSLLNYNFSLLLPFKYRYLQIFVNLRCKTIFFSEFLIEPDCVLIDIASLVI